MFDFFPRHRRIVVLMRVVGEAIEERGEALRRNVFVENVIAEGGRRGAAGAEAFVFDEGELPVLRRLAELDAELGFEAGRYLVGSADFAGERAADSNELLALGLEPVFLV